MMLELAHHLAGIVQASADDSSDGGTNGLAYLFLLSGFLFYGLMYTRYRNVDKRHHHESETKAHLADVQAVDTFQRSLTDLRNSRMRGANNTSVRGSLKKWL